jgi:hypothetical protein
MNTITSPCCGWRKLEQPLAEERNTNAVDELVDEQVIADLERGQHRAARDLERLDDERADEQREQDGHEESFRILPPRRPLLGLDPLRLLGRLHYSPTLRTAKKAS